MREASALLLLTVSLGCSGSTAPEAEQGLYDVVACPGLVLGVGSGMPLDKIAIGTLPAAIQSPVAAVMLDASGQPAGFAYVQDDGAGALELSVPLHPTDAVAGGPVSFTFSDGTTACAPVDFTILPLPAADGELAAVVDLLQAVVDAQLAEVQSTSEELNATPIEDVPPSLWSLALVQALLDAPGNDASLRAIADGGLGADALDLADRLLARTSARASLDAPPPAAVSPARSGPARFSSDDLTCAKAYIQDADDLNYCMELAQRLAESTYGMSREVAEDIKQVFSDLSDNDVPLAGEVKVLFGAMFWVIYAEREAAASVYPSFLAEMDVTVDKDPILEDDSVAAEIRAEVLAGSLGYNMQDQILDGIGQAKSLIDTYGDFDFSTGTELDDLADKLAPVFQDRIKDVDIDALKIPADSFGPIILADTMWLDSRIVSGDALTKLDDTHYRGRLRGTATISVRTGDGLFGDSQLARQIGMEVIPLQVGIDPTDVVLKDSEVKVFTVTVTDSEYPDSVELAWKDPHQGSAVLTLGSGGVHTVQYTAPSQPDPADDVFYVRHTMRTGARELSEEERQATATVHSTRVQLAPVLQCVQPGDTVQLVATVVPPGDVPLVWTYSAGHVDDNGVFIAPGEAGPVEITVALASNPDVKDTITVNVGMCVCSFSVTVGAGSTYVGQPGNLVHYLAFETGDPGAPWAVASVKLEAQSGEFAQFSVDIGASLVTGPGSYPLADIGGTLGFAGAYASYSTDPDLGSLDITEFEPHTVLAGSIVNGVVRDSANPDDPPFSISATFAAYPPPGTYYNEYTCTVQATGG